MWTINKNKNWDALQEFSWVKDMDAVVQSPIHHGEGDVATHTQLVLHALENLEDYKSLSAQEKEIVWAAALLHDVEKRSTTFVDEDGKIVSPGHAKKGAMTTRQILYREIKTTFTIREEVVGLVRYHGLPLWLFEKPNPTKAMLKASLETNTKLLAMLATVDVLGRICNDADELLYKIGLFKELCVEHNCWGVAKEFHSNLARFQYFRKEDRTLDYKPFEDTKGEAIILSGIAGCGKDFYIQKNFKNHFVISLDDLRRSKNIKHNDQKGNGQIIQEAKELSKKYLRKGESFVWNATNITQQMREQLIDLFDTYNANIKIIYLEVTYEKLLGQNKNRNFCIPQVAIEKMINKLEVPKAWEAQEVIYVVA